MATLVLGDEAQRATVRTIELFLEKEIFGKARRFSNRIIRREAGLAADRELGKTFQWIANQILAGSNFKTSGFSSVRGAVWKPYNSKYSARKQKNRGHLRWFLFDRKDEVAGYETLAESLLRVTPSQIVAALGKTQVVISSDEKSIRLILAPNKRVTRHRFEEQLADEGFFDEDTMAKLRNRQNAYRPLLGPAFTYVAKNLLPGAVSRRLRNLK